MPGGRGRRRRTPSGCGACLPRRATSSPNESGVATAATIRSAAAACPVTSRSPPRISVTSPGPRDAEEAHPSARAVLHEEIVADGRDVAAAFVEVGRLGIGEPAWTVGLEDPQRGRRGHEVDAVASDVAREDRDSAVLGDRDIAHGQVRLAPEDLATTRAVCAAPPRPRTADHDAPTRSRRRT